MAKECKWYNEGTCRNEKSRCPGEICDIEPEEYLEDGFEWKEGQQ